MLSMSPLRFLSYSTFTKYYILTCEWHKSHMASQMLHLFLSLCNDENHTLLLLHSSDFMIYFLSIERFILLFKEFFFEWNFLIWKDIFRSRSLLLTSFDWFRYKLKNVMNLRILLWKAFKSLLTSFFFCRSRWLNEMWGYFEGWLVDMDYQRIELRGFLKWSFIFV